MEKTTSALLTAFSYSVLVATSLCMLSCVQSFPTTHPDASKNNPIAYKVDVRDCARSYPETPDGVYLRQRISCLQLKGWK